MSGDASVSVPPPTLQRLPTLPDVTGQMWGLRGQQSRCHEEDVSEEAVKSAFWTFSEQPGTALLLLATAYPSGWDGMGWDGMGGGGEGGGVVCTCLTALNTRDSQ